MAGATLSTLSNILKEYYLGPVQDQFNNEVLVTQILGVDTEHIDLEGLKAVIPLHTARSGGIGSRAELVTLPSAGNQGYQRATYDLKYHYARIQVSGPSISRTQSDAGAFARALKDELDRIKDDVQMDQARQLYGDGTGQIAATTNQGATTSLVLATDEALQKGFIYVGMNIDVGTAVNPQSLSGSPRVVTDVDVPNKTIVISGANITPTGAEFIYRAGNVDNVNGVQEMDSGLQKLLPSSANTVGGINAAGAGTKIWDNLHDNSGTWSLDQLQINWNKCANAGLRANQATALTTPGLARRLFASNDFKNNVRFVNSDTLRGGFESISFNAGGGTINLVTDRLAPFGKCYMFDKKAFRVFSPNDWDFLARDGLTIRWVTDIDAFQAILFRYSNIGTNRRQNALAMTGLTDTGF